jgi:hypothetical protein
MWTKQAWDMVTPNTVENCWRKAGILGGVNNAEAAVALEEESEDRHEAISSLIDQLQLPDPLTAEQYLDLPGEEQTHADLSVSELVDMVQPQVPI